jgi:hypothetical protein
MTGYRVSGTWYLVPGTRNQEPGTWNLNKVYGTLARPIVFASVPNHSVRVGAW